MEIRDKLKQFIHISAEAEALRLKIWRRFTWIYSAKLLLEPEVWRRIRPHLTFSRRMETMEVPPEMISDFESITPLKDRQSPYWPLIMTPSNRPVLAQYLIEKLSLSRNDLELMEELVNLRSEQEDPHKFGKFLASVVAVLGWIVGGIPDVVFDSLHLPQEKIILAAFTVGSASVLIALFLYGLDILQTNRLRQEIRLSKELFVYCRIFCRTSA